MKMVSVVIPTTQKELSLANKCAESVRYSSYTNIEIIIVNEGFERSRQRNLGIDRAKGEYILFLDSDHQIHPFLIADCVELMNSYDALYIPERIATPGWFGRLRNWERQFYTATAVDVVRFVRRAGCPRFDETMAGPEDSDFDRRVGGHRGISRAYINHYDNVGVWEYLRKKAYYSKSMWRFSEKWPGDKCLNLWYRCFGIFVEDRKWILLLKRPIYAIMLAALLFSRGLIYICVRTFY